MKKQNRLFLVLLAVCLLLAACGGEEKEEARTGVVYVPESVAFTSPLDETNSACVAGDMVYLLGMVYGEDLTTEQTMALVRVPLEGGKAEEVPAFRPAQLEDDAECDSTGGYLRPGADGTVWLTENVYCQRFDLPEDFDPEEDEKWQYITSSGTTLVLRQLDSEGNELACFDLSVLAEDLDADWLYDLWTDGSGTFFVNTGEAVVLLDGDGTVRATLEGSNMASKRFVSLGDGRVAIQSASQGADGYTSQLRVIDTEAGDWGAEAFSVPGGARFQSGAGEVLFYYTSGDALYAWHQGAEEAERVMSWVDSGINANGIAAFSFLADERLSVVTQDAGFRSKPSLALLTATDADALPERTVLTLATPVLYGDLRASVAKFNRSSDSCFIEVIDYTPDFSANTTYEDIQQARLRLVTDLVTGNVPDIIELDMSLPARRMEAMGLLEDLWPYIDADPELGRDALMVRPLEAIEYNGGLYRIAPYFVLSTVMGPKSVVGDHMTWTYDDFWAALNTVPNGTAVAGFGSKSYVLSKLVQYDADRFVDWEHYTSRFDGEEFRTLLEFCNRFPSESDPDYIPDVAAYNGDQVLMELLLNGPDWFQYYKGLLGGNVTCAGYPNAVGEVGSRFQLGEPRLAITSSSEHKEEAWSFLRQQLLPSLGANTTPKAGDMIQSFPINRADFEKTMTMAMTPIMGNRGGELQEISRISFGFMFGDVDASIAIDALTQEEYDQIMELYNAAEGTSDYDVNLMNIITEQAGAYFAGDKSLDDTVAAIQSRVGLYLAELQ